MTVETIRTTVRQRCFWLFGALLLLIVSVPFLEGTPNGRMVLNATGLLVLIAAAAATTRNAGSTVVTLLLAAPTVVFQVLALGFGQMNYLLLSQAFGAGFYFAVTTYLLSYVFRRDVLTMDKLYGAAAAFLLLSILWMYFYVLLLAFYPGALSINGEPMKGLSISTMLYFSLATLTATGMSDVLPVHPIARMICALEMVTGVLFLAVLIARLAGSYPQRQG